MPVGLLERATCARDLQTLLDDGGPPVRTHRGLPLRLTDARAGGAEAYERSVDARAELPVEASGWHDRFNVAVWRMFPVTKSALNARHVADLDAAAPGARRSRLRDALTLFDEDGVVIATADDRIEALVRGFQWKRLFWGLRAEISERVAFVPFGHGLLEKLMNPFIGLTARAVFVTVPGDFFLRSWPERQDCLDAAASRIIGGLAVPADLAPVPLLGVPGWWAGNRCAEFYDDRHYFRPGRRGASPGSAAGPNAEVLDHGP